MSWPSVVVSGVGPVCTAGIGREDFAKSLTAGTSSVTNATPDAAQGARHAARALTNFRVDNYLESQKAYLDRSSQLAFSATSLALKDAALDVKALDRTTVALLLGSAAGSLETVDLFFRDYLQKGPRFVKPFLFPHTYPNTPISLLAIEYGLNGFHMHFASGAISSTLALAYGLDLIRQRRALRALAGGYEALSELLLDGWKEVWAMASRQKQEDALPAPGEGAGMVVLEEAETARSRSAQPMAELAGAGLAGVPPSHDEAGGFRKAIRSAMEAALSDAGLPVANLGGIVAHRNGQPTLDREEAAAIFDLLRPQHADQVPVTTLKHLTGETWGTSGVLAVVAGVCALAQGFLPRMPAPLPPLRTGEPPLRFATERDTAMLSAPSLLINTVDPGGAVACLVLRAVPATTPSRRTSDKKRVQTA